MIRNGAYRFVIAICLLANLSVGHSNELVIAANPVDGEQRFAFHYQIESFQQANPDITVKLNAFEHESFKTSVENKIGTDQVIGDVLFWFGGASLRHFADQAWLVDISNLWQTEQWHQRFSQSAKQAVTRNNQQYGLPLYYYQWGIYYRKSIFKELKIATPRTWDEFIRVGETLSKAGIVPITLGSKNHWTAAGWFDYLNLRLNGLDFHLELLNGCIDFNDKRVADVFEHLQVLSKKRYFLEDAPFLDWKNALPYLYHSKSAMMLMGNFFLSSVPESIRPDIGFFPFPSINPEQPLYENAPVDVLILPTHGKNKENAARFLRHMAQADVQSALAKSMDMIPTNKKAALADDEQIRQGAELLGKAKGLAQFFDRDTPPEFAKKAMPLISQFIIRPKEISALQKILEQTRRSVWPTPNISGCSAN